MENKVFLENLPKIKNGNINWKLSVGYEVECIYDNKEYKIIITDYKDGKLTIMCDNKEYSISTGRFKECSLGIFFGKISSDFKIEVGTIIKDNKRDLIILDREFRTAKNGDRKKFYKYKCNKDEYVGWIVEGNLLGHKNGCLYCAGKMILKEGYSLYEKRQDLMRYVKNIEDAKKFSYNSGKKIMCKCPDCGHEKMCLVSNLCNQGFSCNCCGTGFKIPEKFTSNILNQLKIDFSIQLSKTNFSWCDKYKYDFYFIYNGESYILEVHGRQHYEQARRKGGRTLEQEQENDRVKKELALANGINHYLEIDCRESTLEWLELNLNNTIGNMLDLSYVDFKNAFEWAIKYNESKEICNRWNNKKTWETTADLATEFKISTGTVRNYLKFWSSLNKCNYNPNDESRKKHKKASENSAKVKGIRVEAFDKYGNSLGIFDNCHDLSNKSEQIFGKKVTFQSVSEVARGRRKSWFGYKFKYIDI